MLAKTFGGYLPEQLNCIIFASGVSNSLCNEPLEFLRERKLLEEKLAEVEYGQRFIYFSSCSTYDTDLEKTPYVRHKLSMESLVLKYTKGIVFRLPQLAGPNAPSTTILSSIREKALTRSKFTIWENAKRNILDISDVRLLILKILCNQNLTSRLINIANRNYYSVFEIVQTFERLLNLKMDVNYLNKGTAYEIDISSIEEIIDELEIDFDNYLERVIRKYYL